MTQTMNFEVVPADIFIHAAKQTCGRVLQLWKNSAAEPVWSTRLNNQDTVLTLCLIYVLGHKRAFKT